MNLPDPKPDYPPEWDTAEEAERLAEIWGAELEEDGYISMTGWTREYVGDDLYSLAYEWIESERFRTRWN